MKNPKYSAIIVRSLGIILQNVELLSTRVDEEVNYIKEKNDKDNTLLLAHNDISGGQENNQYLGTCVSNHMSKNRSIFVELNELVNDNVSFGDNSSVPIKGKGNIIFHTKDSNC